MLRTSLYKIKENGFKLTKERSRRYPAKTITDSDYADDIGLLANATAQAETLLHSLQWATAGICLHVNTHKMEYKCFNQTGNICTLNVSSLKLVDKVTYLGTSVSSTDTLIDTHGQLLIGYGSYKSQTWSIKWSAVSSKQRSCWYCYMDALHGRLQNLWRKSLLLKNAASNTEQILETVPTKQQLYGHQLFIIKTIKIRQTRHAGHRWRSRDELIRDVLLLTPSLGRAEAGRPDQTYIQQICAGTGCSPEDLPGAKDDSGWRERLCDIRDDSTTSWW